MCLLHGAGPISSVGRISLNGPLCMCGLAVLSRILDPFVHRQPCRSSAHCKVSGGPIHGKAGKLVLASIVIEPLNMLLHGACKVGVSARGTPRRARYRVDACAACLKEITVAKVPSGVANFCSGREMFTETM